MRISDWSSDVCSSDLTTNLRVGRSNRSGRANVNPGRSMTCRGLCFLGANALFRAPSRRAHHDHADRPMHRRRPESHAIHTYFRLGKALLTESWHRAGIVLRMRGYRIVAIRLICVLVAVAGALLSPPAVAEPLPFATQIGRASCRERVCQYV